MRRRKQLWPLAGVLSIVFLAAPDAFSQHPNPRLTLSLGGSTLRGDRSFVAGGDQFRSEFVDGGKFRLRGTLDFTKHWSLEGDYSFGRNNQRILEINGTIQQRDFGVSVGQVHFHLLRFFTSRQSRVRPYLTTGFGAVRYNPTQEAKALALVDEFIENSTLIRSTTLPSFAAGGGLEGRFNRWLGVRLEVKDYITPIPRFGVTQTPSGPGGEFFPVSGIVHNIEASVGIVFFFLR